MRDTSFLLSEREARWPIAAWLSGASAQPRHTTLRLDGIWPSTSPIVRWHAPRTA